MGTNQGITDVSDDAARVTDSPEAADRSDVRVIPNLARAAGRADARSGSNEKMRYGLPPEGAAILQS